MRWLLVLCLLPSLVYSQSGPSRRSLKNLGDNDPEKANELSLKALEKDSTDALAWYVQSRLALNPAVSDPDIDTSDYFLRKAGTYLDSTNVELLNSYRNAGLSGQMIASQRQLIDSAAYTRARNAMEVEAFVFFLDNFPGAARSDSAVYYRDSLAFRLAVSANTYEAYREFMTTYPHAQQVEEARERYEKLYFDIATSDGRRKSYENFLKENPATPYRFEAESAIFSIMTALNTEEAYLEFIKKFPKSTVVPKARNYLFHLLRSEGRPEDFPSGLLSDSLQQVMALDGFWFPVLEEGRFGFMNIDGELAMPASLSELANDYLCDGLAGDVIVMPDGRIISRQGNLIAKHSDIQVKDLGYGVLKLTGPKGTGAMHKAGYTILPNQYDDISLSHNLLEIRENDRWGLATLTGRILLPPRFDEIIIDHGLYFLESDEGWQVLTAAGIQALADAPDDFPALPFYDRFLYDPTTSHLWVRQGDHEAVLDQTLNEIIPMAAQRILRLPAVYVALKGDETSILSHDLMQRYRTTDSFVGYNDRWLVLKKENGQGLFSLQNFRLATLSDSVQLIGRDYAISYFDGARKVYTYGKDPVIIPASATPSLLQADQREWILLRDGNRQTVYSRYGAPLYSGPAERVTPLTDSLLVVERYGKKELVTIEGKKPLPVRFDGVGIPENGLIPLLSGQRFGAYHEKSGTFIRPVSGKRIRPYNQRLFIFQTVGTGLVDLDSREVVPPRFDEIRPWNDTTCLVKSGQEWQFYHIGKGLIDTPPMRSPRFIKDNDDDRLMIVFVNNAFGVFHNRKNEIIPPTLDDIINIGTPVHPVFFTDKFVSEANLHVVVYFDQDGRIIRKQAMEEEQFNRVYCD